MSKIEFKSWRDILAFAEDNGLKHLARRLQLNHECWASSGEFGRDQVVICDEIRFAEDPLEVATTIDAQSEGYMKF